MTVQEVLKKVREIEIKSLRKANAFFLGEYHSSFKGRGMTFSEVRPYQYGDDIRSIDWNKTAHFNEPFVKVFEEERELSLMLMIDVSASMDFGTQTQTKRETAAEIAATLGFSALKNNDKVGLILFSNEVHLFLPPKKGRMHLLRMIREIIHFEAVSSETNFNIALDFLLRTVKRKSIVFMLSDIPNVNFHKTLDIAGRKHDFTAIKLYDAREKEMPNIGFVKVKDLETGKSHYANTSTKQVRLHYGKYFHEMERDTESMFTQSRAHLIPLQPQEDYGRALVQFFRTRNTG